MSRPCCSSCHRPKVACICAFITSVSNDIHVIVLQHPKEVTQTKGTLALLANSLTHCTVFVGEDFSNHVEFNQLLAQYQSEIALLYPSEQAVVLASADQKTSEVERNCQCIILLDATWKKSYRMYKLSKNLQQICHFSLPEHFVGQYLIRNTAKKNALSTLEACCYALTLLENSAEKYQLILENFVKFNHFQLAFRPDANVS